MERDFTKKGTMKPVSREMASTLKGYLPFYSVDTREEADAIIFEALRCGEFHMQYDGSIVEVTLLYEQSLENLDLAGERLAEIHERIKNATVQSTGE